MGYDLHITRAIDWTANRGVCITAEEWLALRSADGELSAYAAFGPYAARFRNTSWLDWYDGNIFTTNPDRATVSKMLAIAKTLGAIVQGDGGEIYESALQWPRKDG